MVQRLGIAGALVNRPKVLLLDEPVSSLDPIGRRDVLEIIEQLGRETTIFMSTHILADVERVCDTVGVINEGRMVAVERVEDLREAHGSRRLELRFDGTAGARHFANRATERGWRATTEEGGRTVWVSPGAGAGTGSGAGAASGAGARAPAADATDDFRREVLRLIVDENIDLESFQTRASLEEAFVRLIGADASKALAGTGEAGGHEERV
jgi:ABC-2 type transport system ATP-binding protein